MFKPTPNVPELLLEISSVDYPFTNPSNEYGHVNLMIRVLDEEGNLTWISRLDDRSKYRFSGIRMRCQTDRDHRGSYAWNIFYCDRYSIRDYKPYTKTLETIDRRLQKLENDLGEARTFGEYVTRVAKILGATVVEQGKDGELIRYKGAEAGRRIDDLIADIRSRYGEKIAQPA